MTERIIKYVFVHCTATRPTATIESIKQEFVRKGWKNPGYHFVVDSTGLIHTMLDIGLVANGVRGYNANAIHVAYIGGIDCNGRPCDTRTGQQRHGLRACVRALQSMFPEARVLGHRDISPDTNHNGIVDPWERIKECPCFDVATEL